MEHLLFHLSLFHYTCHRNGLEDKKENENTKACPNTDIDLLSAIFESHNFNFNFNLNLNLVLHVMRNDILEKSKTNPRVHNLVKLKLEVSHSSPLHF